MWSKPVLSRSSNLVSLPALALVLVLCVLAAFFGQGKLAAVLMFLFLLAFLSRCWATLALRRIAVSVTSQSSGVFPGDEVRFDIEVYNGKFLPLVWLELFFPLSLNLCLVPEKCTREPDEWEKSALSEEGYSTRLAGEKRFSFLLWYETVQISMTWHARQRGIYSTGGWRVRTGDGFGLTQVEQPLAEGDVRQIYIYPKLVKVRPDLFLRNLWNADTGAKGVMEDPTVIRSTRDYQTSDSLKRINWRLTARGLPLSVNVYEDILPKSVHFIFDGESFSGAHPHPVELEDALSVLASELIRLEEAQVRCGLSLSRGQGGTAVNLFAASSTTEDLLCALAAYEPAEPVRDKNSGKIVDQLPDFDAVPLVRSARGVGRFYYIAYSTACLPGRTLLTQYLDHTCASILTYQSDGPFGEYETVCLHSLKEGGHGA